MSGLTSRSSAELVEEANHHNCNIIMKLANGEECDLKSIMNVFAMSVIDKGDTITIEMDGDDEEKALKGFKRLCSMYSF